jgi:hypothetical protein
MGTQAITGAVCPECTNTGYVPESEDEVTGCTEPGCPYWAEHDATQGTITFDLNLPRTNALLERQAEFRRAFLSGELPLSHPIYRNTASELDWDGTIGAMV